MPDPTPKIVEIELKKQYRFMYENFVIVTQSGIYLLLERREENVDVLYFDSPDMKYMSLNDEARGGHPLWKYGMGFYGFFEVLNSPWIREQMMANRVHDRHADDVFTGKRHFIACFKDVMLEVGCRTYEERTTTVSEIEGLVQQQLKHLIE
jgi:hypothetical protein